MCYLFFAWQTRTCTIFTPSSFPDKSRLQKHIERQTSDTCEISCLTSKSKPLFPPLWLSGVSICMTSLEVLMDEWVAVHMYTLPGWFPVMEHDVWCNPQCWFPSMSRLKGMLEHPLTSVPLPFFPKTNEGCGH